MSRTIYIARHGQTDANVGARFPGHRETPLTLLGQEQARAMGRALRQALGARPAIKFVSSPLGRAQATMRLIREELGVEGDGFAIDARLIDIDHGDWTGLTVDEARERFPKNFADFFADKWNVAMQGGESHAHLAARVQGFLDDLVSDAVTVSHGATTQMLRGLLGGLDKTRIPDLDEPQGVVFRARGSLIDRLAPC